ncbi:nucleotidyltransferase domain-containing protein [Mucilaginibacter myungsuensis]|uniref:Cyclic GMP-AMP synthase n=1 Tax=Mucilaginibacter myungsuensis TaxID=649104 RepID=A0A929PXE7_9SPHI|nr:nucleotidyltransferase [Mucilaginibacter myungsuensis]MBE9663783.1 nucleotidyltransferase [Mucilaginibacter myungsuensis]MDN3598502.1 nucleotidyltransferase [Mucilaginibacter myungsuensis]
MTTQFLTYAERQRAGNVLERLAQSIDLTDRQYQDAIARYEAVATFLGDPNGNLAIYNPHLVPQGSFRIGVVVRPEHEECEFDVDTTCWLYINLPASQYRIKQLIADRFKSNATYERMLKEKHRCWRLGYSEQTRFHLDVVPAVPDSYEWLLKLGVPDKYAKHAIKITDNQRYNYHHHTVDWPGSNPEGYALWFLDVMKVQADHIRNQLSAELKLSLDKIPEYKVRTPLQRAIQLMKRHRDQLYGDHDLKPISIIITTLAARAYMDVIKRHQGGLFYDIVIAIVEQMVDHIESRDNVRWIANPVNPTENFADKWQTDPRLAAKFHEWHGKFLALVNGEEITKSFDRTPESLKLSFGSNTVKRAFEPNNVPSSVGQLDRLRNTAAIIASGVAHTDKNAQINNQSIGVKNQEHRFHFNE